MTDRRSPRDEANARPPGSNGGFEWTCPICGQSRTNPTIGETGMQNALAAIRTHIRASEGGGHGPRHEYPDAMNPSMLSDHIIRVDRRGNPTDSNE